MKHTDLNQLRARRARAAQWKQLREAARFTPASHVIVIETLRTKANCIAREWASMYPRFASKQTTN